MKSWIDRRSLSFLAFSACMGFALPSFASPSAAQEGEKKEEAKADDKKKEEKKDEWFAVLNGDVFTGTGAVLRGATVLSKNGVIEAVGHEVEVPTEAKTLDATGLRVYPGLVAINSAGLFGATGGDFADSVDPYNQRMTLALASGITTAGQSNVALKLKRRDIKGVVLRERYLATLSFTNSNPQGKREMFERFDRAARYLRDYRDWEEKKRDNKDLKEPAASGVDSTVRSILEGRVLARFNASNREDLLEIARLAQRFGFRPVIDGCIEGWTVADELGRAGAYAVITPRDRRDKEEQLVRDGGSSIENAAILHRSGVQVCVIPSTTGVDLGGIAGRDILHLPIEAGFAVRGGLTDQAALEAITIVPARLLGVSHRVGSLEKGKDCDLIVLDGDVMHYQSLVQFTVVEGKLVYDKSQELFYAHIRPRPSTQLAPEERKDKGEAEETPKEGSEAKPEEAPKEGDGEKPADPPKDPPKDG
ncbi:MAG: amidohydrolase family protein [Planctomycetota bacterium]|nr:amidohydrolase family protein [Planctomycetota bacterium]